MLLAVRSGGSEFRTPSLQEKAMMLAVPHFFCGCKID